MSVSDIYQKMLQNPKNRVSSSGTVRQPTPFDSGGRLPPGVKKPVREGSSVSTEEAAFLNAVDQRLAYKKANNEEVGGSPDNESSMVTEIVSLKSRVKELEELVTVMMKQQMKLMNED